MDDLFSGMQAPDASGAGAMLHEWPSFFAIYPSAHDRPRVVQWQQAMRRLHAPTMAPRPADLLHVSVAECARPGRLRQALPVALAEAERHFAFPAFDIWFTAIARFGSEGSACVAVADAASQEAVRGLRIALADAQRHAGLFLHRGRQDAHLTLGYGEGLAQQRQDIEPFGFRVTAVDLVASETGRSRHRHLQRWALGQPGHPSRPSPGTVPEHGAGEWPRP